MSSKSVIADPLLGPKLKVKRAKRHLADFKGRWDEFVTSKPYEDITKDDPKTGERIFALRVLSDPPCDLSVIAGDVVHNLRSALDQLVCGLIRANRKEVSGSNGFPISRNKKRFKTAQVAKLKNVSPKAARFIRLLKPYEGGNRYLWLLQQLDNMDKHNQIIPVVAGNVEFRVLKRVPSSFTGLGLPQVIPRVLPLGGVELLKGDCEIYRVSKLALDPHRDPTVTIQMTFGKTGFTRGEPIIEILKDIIQLIERIIDIVERRIL